MRVLSARCVVMLGCVAGIGARPVAAAPVPVIFDTDMCGDCDDVAALAMLHALESRAWCRLLAVTVSADHPRAAPFVDAVNRFYGRDSIPVGVVRPGGVAEQSVYLKLVDATWDDPAFAGRERYPHALRDAADAAEAVGVLRTALAGAPDGAVVVIQVGFSTNLARLLESPPDAVSPLSGVELVARKVRCLQLMAGAFQPIDGDAAYGEYNVVRDRAAAALVAELADGDGVERIRDRHRATLSQPEHPRGLPRRAPSPGGRGLPDPLTAAAGPAELGPDERPRRRVGKPRLFRPVAAGEGDRDGAGGDDLHPRSRRPPPLSHPPRCRGEGPCHRGAGATRQPAALNHAAPSFLSPDPALPRRRHRGRAGWRGGGGNGPPAPPAPAPPPAAG
ncbi:MAG: hypothetical protein EBR86_11545 [Planctomycetia bacterium]|nr:hypothetical protein [Planctomycetia bacterium]